MIRWLRAGLGGLHALVHLLQLSLALAVTVVVLGHMAAAAFDTVGMLTAFALGTFLLLRGQKRAAVVPVAMAVTTSALFLGPSRACAAALAAFLPLCFWQWIRRRRTELGLVPRPSGLGLIGWVLGFRIATWLFAFDPVACLGLIGATLLANADAMKPLATDGAHRRVGLALAVVVVATASMVAHGRLSALRPGPIEGRQWCQGAITPAAPGVLRIATLGDSTTFGALVPWHSSYPRLLESELGEALGQPVEVVNCGIPGSRSRFLAEQLGEALAWKPDVVTVMIGVNDLGEEGWRARLPRHLAATVGDEWRTVVLTYPFGAVFTSEAIPALQEELRSFAADRDLLLVDAAAALPPRPWHYLIDTVHPNQIGHRHIAELLAGALAEEVPEGRPVPPP